MNFNDYISRFRNECNLRLIDNNIKQEKIEKELKAVYKELSNMNKSFHKPLPLALSIGLAGGSGVGLIASMMFQTPLWILYLALTLIFTIIGLANETFAHNKEEDKIFLNEELRHLHRESTINKNEKAYIQSLINNLKQCYQYYNYVLEDNKKNLPVNIRLQAVFESKCMLSTFLYKYYNGELQEFLKESTYEKQKQEAHLRLGEKIFYAKTKNNNDVDLIIPERKYRRRSQYPNLPPERIYTFK